VVEVGDIWEMRIRQFLTGDFENRHVFVVRSATSTWHQQVYDNWRTFCQSLFVARRSASWSIEEVTWRELVPGTAGDVEIEYDTPNGPTFGNQMPAFNAVKIVWQTPLIGKSHRGYSYLGGYRSADQVDSSISNALGAAVGAYAQSMIDVFGPEGGMADVAQFGVISRQFNNEPRDPPIITVISSYYVADTIRGVRRRRIS